MNRDTTAAIERAPVRDNTQSGFPMRVLVLCTGNSARSIMAEALFNSLGSPYFQASSAGSKPTGRVNPLALEQISTLGISTDQYRSKSWQEFSAAQAPDLDVILTVCDNAASEPCSLFDGSAEHIHWALPDPAAIEDDLSAARRAFAACFATLQSRIEGLVSQIDSNSQPDDTIAAMRQFE